MLRREDTVMMLVDVQGKLAEVVHESEELANNLEVLVKGMQCLGVPIIWVEQIPEKMGRTIPVLADLLVADAPISKSSFSCYGTSEIVSALEATGRRSVVLAGIEAHVCVYQTAADLCQNNYQVEVVADAVSSRTAANKEAGLGKIRACGGAVTSVEMVLFELLATADDPALRTMIKLVK